MAHAVGGSNGLPPLAAERWQRTKRANPELTKALAYVQEIAGEARRLLAISAVHSPATCTAASHEIDSIVGDRNGDSLDEDSAWELYTALKQAVLLIDNKPYLSMLLEREAVRDGQATAWHRWTTHFEEQELDDLRKALKGPPAPDASARAARRLAFLYGKRAEAGRERRAKAAAKKRATIFVTPTLLGLLAVFAAGIDIDQGATWRDALVAATAGAVGAALAGFIKLRDKLDSFDDLRAFATTIMIQPLVGATSGLVVLLVVESGIIEIGGGQSHQAPGRALLAFVAGFSEPFFLGLVNRVTHDKPSDAEGPSG